MMRWMLLCLLVTTPGWAANRYTRFEAQYTPALHGCAGNVAEHLYPGMTKTEQWFVEREIAYLNRGPSDVLVVPVYKPFTGRKVCSDIRNWHVAVLKGRKYDVNPSLLIAIRSHENPENWCGCDSRYRRGERDHYAYGVEHLKGTNLWAQTDGAAKIVKRIAGSQGWSPMQPTQARLYRLALVYVGQGKASARNWSRCVWTMMQRAQG